MFSKVRECELLLENICGVSDEEATREMMRGVEDCERREVEGANLLLEMAGMKIFALHFGKDDVLERSLAEGWVGDERDELVRFALTYGSSEGGDKERKSFQIVAG